MTVKNTNRLITAACLHDAKESNNGCIHSRDSQLPLQLLIIICLASHHLPDTRRKIIPFFQERVATASHSEALLGVCVVIPIDIA